ncbi:MAG: MFS transporter [bacterium]
MTTAADAVDRRRRMRLAVGAFLGLAAGMVAMASLEAMLVPIQNDFVLGVDDVNVLVLAVSAGALLVLFAAGGLVDRVGAGRVAVVGAGAATAGALLVGVSAGLPMLMAGRIVGGIGGTALGVAAMALLNEDFTDDRQRAWVFGLFAAFTGIIFAVTPVISGLISDALSWRFVPILWIACAVGAALLTRTVRTPGPSRAAEAREAVTPWAAGLALSALCLSALLLKQGPLYAGVALAVTVAALVTLVARWRWLRAHGRQPALDTSVFRRPGAKALAGAMLTVGVVNLFFYANLYLQYRLGLSPAQAAAIRILPQAAGIAGGLLGGWLSARWGSVTTSAVALAVGCAAALGFALVREESGAWPVIVLLMAFTLPAGCVTGTLTKAFLDCADTSASGAAASWRQACWSVGATLGGVAAGAVVLSYFTRTWSRSLEEAGVDLETTTWMAESVRGGVPLTQVGASVATMDTPARQAIEDFVGLAAAQVSTLRLVAFLAALAYGTSLAFVLVARWRQRQGTSAGAPDARG